MNKSHGFTKENLLRSLPPGLANDPRMVALAEAIAGLLVQQKEETGRLSIYPQIGKLDEALLDILAHDFKVDWWDSDYTLTEKRRTLQTSWQVHKTLGTKAAVQKANTTIEEWFEYGGQPYHFRLSIELGGEHLDREKQARVLERVSYYKNLRSHLDSVSYATKFDTVPFGNHRTAAFWLKTAGFITTARRTALCRVTSGAVSALSPVAYVAFGSGGTDAEGNVLAPSPDQTSLHQEVGRYPVGEPAYPIPTTARYTITIPPDDLAGASISEAALVDADGVLCAIRNMLPKGKDAGVSFTFTFDDEF